MVVEKIDYACWASPTSTQFRVPDYRGIFLRGVGAPSGLDTVTLGAQQVQKTAKNGLANASSSLTVSLNTESANHSHSGTSAGTGSDLFVSNANKPNAGFTTFSFGGLTSGDSAYNGNAHTHTMTVGTQSANHSHTLSSGSAAAQTINGDNETRPINKGINYIIKI